MYFIKHLCFVRTDGLFRFGGASPLLTNLFSPLKYKFTSQLGLSQRSPASATHLLRRPNLDLVISANDPLQGVMSRCLRSYQTLETTVVLHSNGLTSTNNVLGTTGYVQTASQLIPFLTLYLPHPSISSR